MKPTKDEHIGISHVLAPATGIRATVLRGVKIHFVYIT